MPLSVCPAGQNFTSSVISMKVTGGQHAHDDPTKHYHLPEKEFRINTFFGQHVCMIWTSEWNTAGVKTIAGVEGVFSYTIYIFHPKFFFENTVCHLGLGIKAMGGAGTLVHVQV